MMAESWITARLTRPYSLGDLSHYALASRDEQGTHDPRITSRVKSAATRGSQSPGCVLYSQYGDGGSGGHPRSAMRTRVGRRARDNGGIASSHPHAPFLAGCRIHVRGTAGGVARPAAARHHQAGGLRRSPRPPAGG